MKQKKNKKRLVARGVIFLISCFAFTPLVFAQTIPYGSNNSYSYGTMQTYQSNALADANAQSWYNYWKSNFTLACGAPNTNKTLAVNDYSSTSAYSEGQGYGLLLAAYSGDQALFDELWEGYKDYKNVHGVMDWTVNCTGTSAANGATDGDLDAAMALLIANKQWPGTTSPYNYATEATTLITAIRDWEFTTCSGETVQKPGDMFGGCNCTNPSYYAVGYYRAFAQHVPAQSAFWTKAASDGYDILLAIQNGTTGLVPAWTDSGAGLTGGSGDCSGIAASGGGARNEYQFDAARTPWRVLIDYLWWGTPQSKTFLDKMTTWVNGVGISNIVAGYKLNGTANVSYKNSAFTGAFAIGAMTSGNQTTVNNYYDWWINHSVTSGAVGTNLDDRPYFQNSLRTLYSFVASGNFWNPYNGTCLQPNLGANLSTCSGTTLPVTLNSNTTTATGVTYTWYRNGTAIGSQTSPTCPSCGTVVGTYVVVRDSTGGCSKRDTVLISSTIPAPTITGPLALCNPASYNLTPSNAAGFPGGTTWQWAVDYTGGTTYNNITGETASTLSNVRTAGRYRLTATAGACTNNGNVVVTSSLPTPVDGCNSVAGNVSLSIANPNLNGTNYNWYTTAGGSTLATTVPVNTATGTTGITVNVASTTTFYVQDMSAVNGNVGPTALSFGATQNWGCTNQHNLRFTAASDFTLKSFYLRGEYNNSNPSSVTIEILNSSNTVVATFTTDNNTTHPASGESLQKYTFNGGAGVFIDRTTWGANLKMRLSGTCTDVQARWTQGGASYPYVSAGSIVTIVGAGTNGTDNTSDYHFFYNWEISTGSTCARIPVIARIAGGCVSAPVELVNFYAEKGEGRTILNWLTASELNNDYFNIERSLDGETFEVIGTVNGMGTSNNATVYSYADENIPSGKAYYRLTQVDFDGQTSSSAIISVDQGQEALQIQVAPNPFDHSTQVFIGSKQTEKARIKITDLSGHVIYESLVVTNEKQHLGESLPSGVYLLHVSLGNNQKVSKIVKQ